MKLLDRNGKQSPKQPTPIPPNKIKGWPFEFRNTLRWGIQTATRICDPHAHQYQPPSSGSPNGAAPSSPGLRGPTELPWVHSQIKNNPKGSYGQSAHRQKTPKYLIILPYRRNRLPPALAKGFHSGK